jgi:hypothetical protein
MMSKFRMWYIENQDAITWFVIGLMVSNGITHLSRGQLGWAAFDFGIAFLNFSLRRQRL